MRLLDLLPPSRDGWLLVGVVGLLRVTAHGLAGVIAGGNLLLVLHRVGVQPHLRLLRRLDVKEHVMVELIVFSKVDVIVGLNILGQGLRIVVLRVRGEFAVVNTGLVPSRLHR